MKKLIVFSGAGISACSGISTFRDSDGLWENHSVDRVANIMTFKANFDLVHRFYNERRSQLASVAPNPAHVMVADWQNRYDTTIITQNVDDLFERAGCKDVLHVHGNLLQMQCLACGHSWDVGHTPYDPDERCASPKCNSKMGVKPNVVFFNEIAPHYPAMFKAFRELKAGDVLVVIGTSGQVIDIGSIAVNARELGVHTILSNLDSGSGVSLPGNPAIEDRQFNTIIHGRASEVITDIDRKIREYLDD